MIKAAATCMSEERHAPVLDEEARHFHVGVDTRDHERRFVELVSDVDVHSSRECVLERLQVLVFRRVAHVLVLALRSRQVPRRVVLERVVGRLVSGKRDSLPVILSLSHV